MSDKLVDPSASELWRKAQDEQPHQPAFTMENPRQEDERIISQAREKASPMVDGTAGQGKAPQDEAGKATGEQE